jgi:hypothetical protein
MEIRIGITQALREITVEIGDDKARGAFKSSVEAALSGKADVLHVVDDKGREVLLPSAKIAYVEFGAPDGTRKLGFGS